MTGKRAAHRQEMAETIKATARSLLSRHGAAGLSLREVAREMGQSSSALYRYFATRDELLTELIIDAYNDLGAAVERAEGRVARDDLDNRWRSAARAIRKWALANPHEYALIFGTPVPGYQAPERTIVAATRVTTVISKIVDDAYESMPRRNDDRDRSLLWDAVDTVMPHVPSSIQVRSILVWEQVFGFVNFELFGHFVGSVDRTDVLFERLIGDTGEWLGINKGE